MVRLSIELDDHAYDQLRRMADNSGQSVEALIAALAEREALAEHGITEEFLADVQDMIETYRPVFNRLAQ
ncbi:MAG: hypothetical protein U5Q44_11560 [Dehalococcoidia bacterium]|nr:hypothetical protein [Dehalococcoidia bacterium]